MKKINTSGIAALLIVVIIGATALIMALGASLLGMGELEMGYLSHRGGEVSTFGDGCVENTLEQLRKNNNYTGETLVNLENSCIIDVQTNGNLRNIFVTSTQSSMTTQFEVVADISQNPISILSWIQK